MDFQTKINNVILAFSLLDDEPCSNTKLKDDLGFDSLKLVELIIGLEEEFNIQIDESDLDPSQLVTVDDLYKLLKKYVSQEICLCYGI